MDKLCALLTTNGVGCVEIRNCVIYLRKNWTQLFESTVEPLDLLIMLSFDVDTIPALNRMLTSKATNNTFNLTHMQHITQRSFLYVKNA